MPIKLARRVVFDRAEQRTVEISAMPGLAQIILYRGLRGRIDRHKTDLPALAPDAKMQNTLTALQVFHAQRT